MKFIPLHHAIRLIGLVLLGSLIFVVPVLAAEPVEVTADQVKEMLDSDQATVVFPLSLIEFNNLHITGSINVPMYEIPEGLPADKDRPLVFYCLGFT